MRGEKPDSILFYSERKFLVIVVVASCIPGCVAILSTDASCHSISDIQAPRGAPEPSSDEDKDEIRWQYDLCNLE